MPRKAGNMTARISAGWLTLVVFVSAFVIAPAAHLTFHAVPHTHDGGGTHYHLGEASGHDHGETDHRGRRDHAGGHREPFDPAHGTNSVTHLSNNIAPELSTFAALVSCGPLVVELLPNDEWQIRTAVFPLAHLVRGPPTIV